MKLIKIIIGSGFLTVILTGSYLKSISVEHSNNDSISTIKEVKSMEEDTLILNQTSMFPALLVKENGTSSPLELNELQIDINVVGHIATTTFKMTFYNDSERILEGQLYFPLGENKTVSRFAMDVSGEYREGVIVEKEKGRVAFESTTRRTIDPGLLEWSKGNNFKARVYPIPAKGTKNIIFSYEQELISSKDGLNYIMPLGIEQVVRKFELNERAREITFSDRYSICVINLNKLPLNNSGIYKKLARDFYNDTYLVDQNACSSPHLIIWYGKNNNEKKKRFWKNVLDVVKLKYDLSERLAIEKYYELCSQLSKSNNIKSEIRYENLIYTLNLKSLISDMDNFRGKGGFFYEFNTSNMNDVAKIINKKYQTLTYFGFSKNFLRDFLFDNSLKGIDRCVPIGKALDIGLIWDGYDLNKFLTRIIDIK